MRAQIHTFLILFSLGLPLACTGGSGGAAAVDEAPSGLSNQAGPVERPPVTVDSGPQESCVEYVQYAEDYEPEEVPELCKSAYENAPKAFHPQDPPELPQRVIPVIEGPAVVNTNYDVIIQNPQRVQPLVPQDFMPDDIIRFKP
jgi:hypothetical protein